MVGSSISKLQLSTLLQTGKLNVEADALSWKPWHKTKSDYWYLNPLTVKAIVGGCTTEISLIEAYVGKAVIPPQENTSSKTDIDQDSLIMNQEWKEQQNKDENIVEIVNLLKDKKLSQQKYVVRTLKK